jgi:3-oxoacyl-[acyl-carrier protein] reductase
MGRLDGKVALITGGNSGIGLASAHLFAREGAAIFLVGRNEDTGAAAVASLAADGIRSEFLPADVGDPAQVEALFSELARRTERLDVLFNSAGWGGRGSLRDEPLEQWAAVLNDNVGGTYYCCRYALPLLEAAGQASIINAASIAAYRGPDPGLPWHRMGIAYRAAKGGVLALSRALAVQLGPKRIRVNTIVPGVIMTDRLRRAAAETPSYTDSLLEAQALPYLGQPSDVAQLALFLASDDSAFITGAAIPIDGGLQAK